MKEIKGKKSSRLYLCMCLCVCWDDEEGEEEEEERRENTCLDREQRQV